MLNHFPNVSNFKLHEFSMAQQLQPTLTNTGFSSKWNAPQQNDGSSHRSNQVVRKKDMKDVKQKSLPNQQQISRPNRQHPP